MMLDRFYPIVESAHWVEQLVAWGARLVQLRMKDRSTSTITEHVRAAKAACERADAQLIVNDHWEVAIAQACNFVHLGQGDLDGADLPAIRKAGLRLGVSTHDPAELERALELQPDYIALGPIYPTTLKKMPWAPQGLTRIAEWKQRIGTTPLIAIGGLTAERAPAVLEAGADVAAVVTDVIQSADPRARTRQWISMTRPPR